MRRCVVVVVLAVLLLSCMGKRVVTHRVVLPAPPVCTEELPEVQFYPCGGAICLDVGAASALIYREGARQACQEAWKRWAEFVCSRPNVLCR